MLPDSPQSPSGADSGESDEFLEYAAGVFREINLLEIRKSYRLLSELEPHVIENFVQKYSDFIIFLLNILDSKRSNELLSKLTDSALVYIVEEELRTLLIREVGNIARVGGDFTDLSLFLEISDRPTEQEEIPEFTQRVIAMGDTFREASGRLYFAALDNVSPERRAKVLAMTADRNLHVTVGLLFFSSEEVQAAALDEIADRKPVLLRFMPDEWFRIRFRRNYAPYLRQGIFSNLPDSVQSRLSTLANFLDAEKQEVQSIRTIMRDEDKKPAERRKLSLDLIYGLMQRAPDEETGDLMLQKFVQEGLLAGDDRDLIRTVARK